MQAWESIQTSVNYIEDHLSEEIKIKELAEVAALSPFYFQRLFSRLVRKPVNEYIKLRRLGKAAGALEEKGVRIMDIALDHGFSSHANFTRAFKDVYGLTPDEYRTNPVILNHFVKPELLLNYIMVDEGVPIITDGMVLEVNRKKLSAPRYFIGIEQEIPICELMGGEATGIATAALLWDRFHHQKSQIPGLLPGGNELGALYMGNAREGCCIYLAGAETQSERSADGFQSFVLPAAEYIICGFEAETISELYGSAVFKADRFMERWMKEHKLAATDFAVEMYYPPSPEAAYLEHWVVPVPAE